MTNVRSWWTPIKVGLALSALVSIGFIVMAAQRNCILLESAVLECQSNWAWFSASKPNEIGDALAGFAGTLAFIWIVVTVWLQSTELAEQREVLREQKEEFKLMVAAQDAQVEALREQAAVFKMEQNQRSEDRAELELNALLVSCRRLVEERKQSDKFLEWLTNSGTYLRRSSTNERGSFSAYSLYDNATTEDDFAIQMNELIAKQVSPPSDDAGAPRRRGFSALDTIDTGGVELLRDLLQRALLLEEKLSTAQRYRLKSLRLVSTLALLDQVLANPEAMLEIPHSAEES